MTMRSSAAAADLLALRQGLGRSGLLILALLVPIGIAFLPTTIVILVAMVPTAVALIIDRSPEKLAPLTVGALNLAGTMPYVITLWRSGHGFPAALAIITDPVS